MNLGKVKKIELTKKTAYLAGAVIGDGYISNSFKSSKNHAKDYRISFELADKEYLMELLRIIKFLTKTKSNLKKVTEKRGRKQRYSFQVRNKSLHYFLNDFLGIPKGKKSDKVFIPKEIKISNREIKKHFLAGLFDTDGGIRGHTIGFTTASKKLLNDTSKMLTCFSIKHLKEGWTNKKYKKEYYGIRLYKPEIDKFLYLLPFRNKLKIKIIKHKLRWGCRSGQTG